MQKCNQLTDHAKAKEAAEGVGKDAEEKARQKAEKIEADAAAAKAVVEKIESLGEVKTLEHAEAVKRVKEAFEKLTDEQKELVPSKAKEKLDDAKKMADEVESTVERASYAASLAGFTDLEAGSWYLDRTPGTGAFDYGVLYLEFTVRNNLMTGYKDTTLFGPDNTLSRAEAATIIYRLANDDISATTDESRYAANESGLPDVEDGKYYTAAVNWAVRQGVITGYVDETGKPTGFGPYDEVSREQLATIIARYCMSDAAGATAPSKQASDVYDDASSIGSWAQQGAAFCNEHGIMTGVGGTRDFAPQAHASRAQMAKIIAVTDREVL